MGGLGVVGFWAGGSWGGHRGSGVVIILYLIMYWKNVRKWLLLMINRIICPDGAVNEQFLAGKLKFFEKLSEKSKFFKNVFEKIEIFRKLTWKKSTFLGNCLMKSKFLGNLPGKQKFF